MNEPAKNIDKRASIRIVTDNALITADGLGSLSLNAYKLFLVAIGQCRMEDKEFYEYKTTPIELAEMWGIDPSNLYRTVEDIGKELMKIVVKVQKKDGGEKSFQLRHLFDRCDYEDDKYLYFRLHKDMADVLLGLRKNFSKPEMWDFMRLKSKYSIKLWHLMQREMKSFKPLIGGPSMEFYLSMEELRKVTGTENKLKQIGQFKKTVLDIAIKDIQENCLARIEYHNVKKGKRIIGFDFVVNSYFQVDPESLPYRTRLKGRRAELYRKRIDGNIDPDEMDELNFLNKNLEQISMEDFDTNGQYIQDEYEELKKKQENEAETAEKVGTYEEVVSSYDIDNEEQDSVARPESMRAKYWKKTKSNNTDAFQRFIAYLNTNNLDIDTFEAMYDQDDCGRIFMDWVKGEQVELI